MIEGSGGRALSAATGTIRAIRTSAMIRTGWSFASTALPVGSTPSTAKRALPPGPAD